MKTNVVLPLLLAAMAISPMQAQTMSFFRQFTTPGIDWLPRSRRMRRAFTYSGTGRVRANCRATRHRSCVQEFAQQIAICNHTEEMARTRSVMPNREDVIPVNRPSCEEPSGADRREAIQIPGW
jgi:hypothetical protein